MTRLNKKLQDINSYFDMKIDEIMDPGKEERVMDRVRNTPLLAAGVRGFDRLKWQIKEGIDVGL